MLLTFFISIQTRLHSRGAWLWLALASLACSVPARAQSTYVICNSYLEADVSGDGQGLVTIYYTPCGAHNTVIVHPARTSYLTVNVDGNYYTNDQHLPLSGSSMPEPAFPAGYLENGTTKYTGPNKDTIETVWEPQGPNTYKIIQDIYLVEFPIVGSGQVVYRFSAENLQQKPFSAQAQYMLDIDLGTPTADNDDAPVTTRYGMLNNAWTSFPTTNSIPPYFIPTLEPLNSALFPLLIAEGYCNDSLAPEPMGLTEPSLFSFVDWREIVNGGGTCPNGWTWGGPSNGCEYPTIGDEALIFQWPGSGSDSGQTMVLGKFSYGSAACANQICYGNLDAIMLHPEHIVWNGTSYAPDPFPVDAIVWNPNLQNASTASGTQTITNATTGVANGPIKIIAPLPTTNNGYTQTHSLSDSGTIAGQQSGAISWEDQVLSGNVPGSLIDCSTDSLYNIAFSVAAGGVGSTSCTNGTYICPVEVDCQEKDIYPPRHSPHVNVGNVNSCGNYKEISDSVYDDRPTDQGLQSISWYATPNNASVTVDTGSHTSCTNAEVSITVTQVDTVQSPCVYFTFMDCANPPNISYDTICFDRCLPPVPFDTLSPRIRLLNRYNDNFGPPSDSAGLACEYQCSSFVVTDSVEQPLPGLQEDGGLDSIFVVDSFNMNFSLLHRVTVGLKEDTFSVCVKDSLQNGMIVVGAQDSAGNLPTFDTIYYCTVPDTIPPVLIVTPQGGGWLVNVSETHPWDRGIDSILITGIENCWPVATPVMFTIDTVNDSTCSIRPITPCVDSLYFTMKIPDTFENACYTIDARDCAGNSVSGGRICKLALADNFCPSDTVIDLGDDSIMVIFYDLHVVDGDTINYDAGVDSIWFYNVHNMSMIYKVYKNNVMPVPAYIQEDTLTTPHPPTYPKFDTVIFFVTDTTLQDTLPASICWGAIDGAGNRLCLGNTLCWSHPLTQDTTAPLITLTYDPCGSIEVNITDTAALDLGLATVYLDTSAQTVNLPTYSVHESGAKTLNFSLLIPDRQKSASGHLFALDLYGDGPDVPLPIRQLHTTAPEFQVYRQDLALQASGIVNTTSNTGVTFSIPVYLTATDTFALAGKQIDGCTFTIQLTGSQLLSFISASSTNGWAVNVLPGGQPRSYTITAIGAPLTAAVDPLSGNPDTILYLQCTGAKSPDVEEAQIVIDTDACGDGVSYFVNGDTIVTDSGFNVAGGGITWHATMPAPKGNVAGSTIVFMDTCATIIGNNAHPTVWSLAPAIPNPFTNTTLVEYTVPGEASSSAMNQASIVGDASSKGAWVAIDLYNALGEKVRTLVSQTQKQGTYQVAIDGSTLPAGNYFVRLQAEGTVLSQQISLTK
jgi:hypothetical protein